VREPKLLYLPLYLSLKRYQYHSSTTVK